VHDKSVTTVCPSYESESTCVSGGLVFSQTIAISVPKLEKSRKVAEFVALFALTLGDKSADKNMFKLEQDQFWEH
jgi:hypothetical protein